MQMIINLFINYFFLKSVWIKALILKLENYGIKGKLLFWLKSYLSRQKQRVVIKDAISSTGELKAGVPQGSVLGPLLFLIKLFSKCLVLKIMISVLLRLNFTSHLHDHAFIYSKSVLINVCKLLLFYMGNM
jgi:hypothetical protein